MIDPEDYKKVDLYIYQRIIGKLMDLSYEIRPDIAFIIGQLRRHNADPKKRLFQVAKRLVRYLKGTTNISLIFGRELVDQLPRDPPPYSLLEYIDSNFAEDPED